MNTGKKQALFLVDCGYSKSDAVYSDQRYRTICRACTKILFFLSKFPDKEHLRNVQWNYKLFSTQTLTTTPLRHESTHFQDIRSDNLESFFKELKNSQIQSGTRTRQVLGVAQPVQLLYNALAAAVQDFAWDAPEIISPIRRLTSQKHSDIGRTRRRTQSAKQPTLRMNYIFICGTSPENELELREFCRVPGGERLTSEDGVPCPLKDYVQKKLLPSPLLAQLESRGIAVHWVHFSNCGTFNGHHSPILALMADLLSQTRGTLIPSSTLCCPVKETLLTSTISSDKEILRDTDTTRHSKQTRHGSSSDEAVMRNVATSGPDPHMEVECSEELAIHHTKPNMVAQSTDKLTCTYSESKQINESSKALLTRLNDPPLSADTHTNPSSLNSHTSQFSGSTSNQQLLSSKSQLQDNSKSTQVIFEDVLSTLVLPSSSCLRSYLQGCVAKRATTELTTAGEENLYWLCTTTGKILCILELNSMYNIKKLPPSQPIIDPPTTGPITDFKTTKSHSREKKGSIVYNLTTSQPLAGAYKRKKKINKKLNFSKADEKNNVVVTKSSETDAKGRLANVTAIDSRGSVDYRRSSTNPHIVIVGVVKRSDVPLTSLCPASACSCSGLYVPRETRHKHIHTHLHQYGDISTGVQSTLENKPPLEASGSSVSIKTPHSSPSPSTRGSVCKTPEMATVTRRLGAHLPKTPEMLTSARNLVSAKSPSSSTFPQTHLTKHLFTPPSRLGIKRALDNHRKRSKSAPLTALYRTLDSAIAQCLDGSVTVDVCRCIPPLTDNLITKSRQNTNSQLSPRMRPRGQRLQRSISMSPRYPVIRLRNVLSDNTHSCRGDSAKVPIASDCLSESGRFHSKQFQSLCLWLAQNELFLVANVSTHNSSHSLALLQPITSLVASLTLVRSRFRSKLLSKLVKEPTVTLSAVKNPAPSLNLRSTPFCTKVGSLSATCLGDSVEQASSCVKDDDKIKGREQESYMKSTCVTADGDNGGGVSLQESIPNRRHIDSSRILSRLNFAPSQHDRKVNKTNSRSKGSLFGVSCGASKSGKEEGSRFTCDAELLADLSLLFKRPSQEGRDGVSSTRAILLDSMTHLPPFTHRILLPWFSYSQTCGTRKTNFDPLYRIHSASKDTPSSDSAQRKLDLVSKLRCLYDNRDTAVVGTSLISHQVFSPCDTTDGQQGQRSTRDIQNGPVSVNGPSEEKAEDGGSLTMATLNELRDWFQKSYQEQIEAPEDQIMKGDILQRWTLVTLLQFSESFTDIVTKNHSASNPLTASDVQSLLWEEMKLSVLVSGRNLGEKYEALLKDVLDGGGRKEREVDQEAMDGNKERENKLEESLSCKRLSEYLLQVFLRFEVLKICSSADTAEFANQLIFLLRKISLIANPGVLGNLMKKIVLPLYIYSCKTVLLEVYEGLMLPLPPDLDPDPDGETDSPGASQGEEQASSGEESSLFSLEECVSHKRPHLSIKKLARHTSFQDVASQRQITILSKKKKKKKKKRKRIKKAERSSKLGEPLAALRRSPRIAKLSQDASADKGRTGVCRSLFSRSHSVCESFVSLKRQRAESEEENERRAKKRKVSGIRRHSTVALDVVVKETPVKKQVENYHKFKLQRLRSKSSIITSPDVIAIEESPRRSFYSKPRITRLPDPEVPLFNTPPIKEHTKKQVSPANLLKKKPSPATLHSLLHGQILSPSANKVSNSQGRKSQLTHSLSDAGHHPKTSSHSTLQLQVGTVTDSLSESPELFGADFQSPSIQASNVIGRTPSKKFTSQGGFSTPTSVLGAGSTGMLSISNTSKPINYRSARMLTYDSENPIRLKRDSSTTQNNEEVDLSSVREDTQINVNSTNQPLFSASLQREENTILDIPSLYLPSTYPSTLHEEHTSDVVLISPPTNVDLDRESAQLVGGACLLTDLDPSIENESASMMAFALSTPTKDDRRNFHNVFLNDHSNSST